MFEILKNFEQIKLVNFLPKVIGLATALYKKYVIESLKLLLDMKKSFLVNLISKTMSFRKIVFPHTLFLQSCTNNLRIFEGSILLSFC